MLTVDRTRPKTAIPDACQIRDLIVRRLRTQLRDTSCHEQRKHYRSYGISFYEHCGLYNCLHNFPAFRFNFADVPAFDADFLISIKGLI
jgi:hypothetical protein